MAQKITEENIIQAQASWGEGVVKIGKSWEEKKDFVTETKDFIENHYGYNEGAVLFKPTLAENEQFRDTAEKALSYFIGGNDSKCEEDHGFAIHPWVKVRFSNTGIILKNDHALAMGNYYFTDKEGSETKVEYSFGYFLDNNGNIKINLHHSSLPYSGK